MMPILAILKAKFSFPVSIFRERPLAPKLVALAFIVLILGIMAGLYFALRRAFFVLAIAGYFGPPLTLFVLEEFFLLVFALFVLSAAIAGFFVHFRSSDMPFLLSSPISPRRLFLLKYIETGILSSWPLIFFGIPLFSAYGSIHGGGILYGAFVLLLSGSFLFLMSSAATLALFATALIIRRLPSVLSFITAIALLAVLGNVLVSALTPETSSLVRIFQAENLDSAIAETEHVKESFSAWPSHWFAEALFTFPATPALSWRVAGALAALAAFLFALAAFLLGPLQKRLAVLWQETSFIARTTGARRIRSLFSHFFAAAKSPGAAFAAKDITMFARNPREYTRAAFMFFLLFIYMIAVMGIRRRIGAPGPEGEAIIFSLHLGAIAYFMTMLSLRFAYPAISLEGWSAWVLWTSPFSRRRLLLEKFFVLGASFFLIAQILLWATSSAFGLSGSALLLAGTALLGLAAVTVALALCLGTYFADFKINDPDRLSTSTGGLLFMFASLGTGGLFALVYFLYSATPSGTIILLSLLGVSLALASALLAAGMKKIDTLEVL